MEIEFQYTGENINTQHQALFGYSTNGSDFFQFYVHKGYNTEPVDPPHFTVCWNTAYASYLTVTNKYKIIITKQNGSWTINNMEQGPFGDTTITSTQNLTLCNRYDYNNDEYNLFSYVKLYSLKVWDNLNNLVRDMIPVKRKKNNEICMYCKVTDSFFLNSGSGDFIAGPEVE